MYSLSPSMQVAFSWHCTSIHKPGCSAGRALRRLVCVCPCVREREDGVGDDKVSGTHQQVRRGRLDETS
jgi:hypothetical protein